MENFIAKLGEVVLFHRKRSGLSRNELAKLAGVGKTFIYDVEHGRTTITLSNLQSVLEVLNIKLTFESPYKDEFYK